MPEEQTHVSHIADRQRDGWALCGVKLPTVRVGMKPRPGGAEFCPVCEKRWRR
jgi:hypothetical protein